MPFNAKSFKHKICQLIFVPAFTTVLLLSFSLLSLCVYELSKFVDMRGSAITRKTAQLIYTPILKQDQELIQMLLDGSMEDPYVRALDVQLNTGGKSFHSGPQFLPTTEHTIVPNSLTPVRRETPRSILFSSPITDKNGLNPIGWVEMEVFSSPYIVIRYQSILLTIGITLFCLCIAIYLAICLFKAITEPLAHIQQIINRLAEGKLTSRVNPQKSREFMHLANAVNEMAESMEKEQYNFQYHIDQTTKDLRETLETIEIKNIELDIARKEALETSRIKSEFLANTSHEIRTPLNGILGFVALTLKTHLNEQQADYINTIRDSAQNLLTVINGILDFSKLEAGKLSLDYAPLPLRQTIDETLQTLASDANAKNLQLISYIESSIPRNLLGDSLRFKQVLSNLIGNAIKFSTHGNIIIRVNAIAKQETHLMLKVSISDQGKGLTTEQQNSLFKPFTQADSSNSREQGGAGLGLAICKGLVERMKGEIGIISQPDMGSTFWFTTRFGIDKNQKTTLLPQLNNHRLLLCSNSPDSLAQLQSLLNEWQIQQHSISEIHDAFPVIRQAQNHNPFEILIFDMLPNERKMPAVLLNNISEQLVDEFNCKIIVCCTAEQQRQLNSNTSNHNTIFIRKPITYDNLLKTLCDSLNVSLNNCYQDESQINDNIAPSTSVLLVDDNPANLQLASELLRELNTLVTQATNGLQAIEACKHNQFDVVFMDIQMPGMDGFEATRRIREMETGSHRTPIIALTAHSITEQKTQLLISGMDDCISKPVTEAQLAHIINRWTCLSGKKEVSVSDTTKSTNSVITSSDIQTEINSSVDIGLCIKLANNKPALARDMLTMMLASLATEKHDINQAIASQNIPLLAELIHRLYGSSCYCGVPQLKSISGLLDKLLQTQKITEIEPAIATLNHAIDDLLYWGENRNLDDVFGLSSQVNVQEKLNN